MAGAACIHQGKLAYYVLPPVGRLGLLKLGLRMVRRKLTPATDFHLLCSDAIHVRTRARSLSIAYDGELVRLKSPLTFRMRPDALRVLVPNPQQEQSAA
jgi:diacylglycerol kinase family enzyme